MYADCRMSSNFDYVRGILVLVPMGENDEDNLWIDFYIGYVISFFLFTFRTSIISYFISTENQGVLHSYVF